MKGCIKGGGGRKLQDVAVAAIRNDIGIPDDVADTEIRYTWI